jgi:hypothetical protein
MKIARFIANKMIVKGTAVKRVYFIENFGLETNNKDTIQKALNNSFGIIS